MPGRGPAARSTTLRRRCLASGGSAAARPRALLGSAPTAALARSSFRAVAASGCGRRRRPRSAARPPKRGRRCRRRAGRTTAAKGGAPRAIELGHAAIAEQPQEVAGLVGVHLDPRGREVEATDVDEPLQCHFQRRRFRRPGAVLAPLRRPKDFGRSTPVLRARADRDALPRGVVVPTVVGASRAFSVEAGHLGSHSQRCVASTSSRDGT